MDVSEVKVLARRANGILYLLPVFILICTFGLVYSVLVLKEVIEPDRDTLYIIYMLTLSGSSRYTYRTGGMSHKTRRFNMAWDNEFVYNLDATDDANYGYLSYYLDWVLWECIVWYGLCLLVLLVLFIERLYVPKVIMEYDDYGLYIYQRGEPTKLLRYEELWSTCSEEDLENIEMCYHRGFYRARNIRISNPFWGMIKTGSIRIETPEGFINVGGIYHVKDVEYEIKRMVRKNRKKFIDETEQRIATDQRKRELEELAKHNPDT